MLKSFLICMLLAFMVFLVFQVCELHAHVKLLEECVAETVTTTEVKDIIKQILIEHKSENKY